MLHGKLRGRRTVKVKEHQPRGAHKMGAFPRRRNFEEGSQGTAALQAAMRVFTAEFGDAHEQDKNFYVKLRQVAHFGAFLVNEKYGEYVRVEKTKAGDEVLVVAVTEKGAAKRPPAAAIIEYMLVQVCSQGRVGRVG